MEVKPKSNLNVIEYSINKWIIKILEYKDGRIGIIIGKRKNGTYSKMVYLPPLVNQQLKIPKNFFPKYLIEKFPWIIEQPEVVQ